MLRSFLLGLSILAFISTTTEASSRPAGCPHRFCGCALSIKVFGHSVRDLWLASNWFRFPRVSPAPGMVAVRRGHVFQLLAHVGGSKWEVWDPNSGGGRTRVHHRSIAGLTIVSPQGGRMASHGKTPTLSMRQASARPYRPRKERVRQASYRQEPRLVSEMLEVTSR